MIECCSDIAQMQADHYQPRNWGLRMGAINQWGGNTPLRFLLTGFPIADPQPGRPAWAVSAHRDTVRVGT
jgi:hypothetical protein